MYAKTAQKFYSQFSRSIDPLMRVGGVRGLKSKSGSGRVHHSTLSAALPTFPASEVEVLIPPPPQKTSPLFKSDVFEGRHIGPNAQERSAMLESLGYKTMEELIADTVPDKIRLQRALSLDDPLSESELIAAIKEIAAQNEVGWKNFLGMGKLSID